MRSWLSHSHFSSHLNSRRALQLLAPGLAEALRYREEGHAQGKVVITIRHGEDAQASV